MLRTEAGKPDAIARFVLVAHAERADKEGRDSHPGPAALIEATGLDERTIDRAEKRLEAAGLIKRDGVSRVGTTRWNLNLSMERGDDGVYSPRSRIERRRLADAERQRRRRERLQTGLAASEERPVTDGESVMSRTLNPDVTDSASGCHGRNAPQTTLRTTLEPSVGTTPGGTLPPDPLRPQDLPSSDLGFDSENSISSQAGQPPRPDTATHDRAREGQTPTGPRTRADEGKKIPGSERGYGVCLTCARAGAFTIAVDAATGDRCATHTADPQEAPR
jgi:hypothetical protein